MFSVYCTTLRLGMNPEEINNYRRVLKGKTVLLSIDISAVCDHGIALFSSLNIQFSIFYSESMRETVVKLEKTAISLAWSDIHFGKLCSCCYLFLFSLLLIFAFYKTKYKKKCI